MRPATAVLGALAAALASVGAAASVPALHTEGPPPGHTGGFGEPTCILCHVGNDPNAFGGKVSIQGLPEEYERAGRYVLTVVLEAEETGLAGFQLAARYGGGREWGTEAGVLVPLDARVTVTRGVNGVPYAHHTLDGSETSVPDLATWSLEWIAPSTGGPVSIHVAANSGNGDNSPLSDLIYTADVSVPPVRNHSPAAESVR